MLATCEHASGVGGMYVYDAYLQEMWTGAAIPCKYALQLVHEP